MSIEEGKGKAAHSVTIADGRFAIAAGQTETISFAGKKEPGKILGSLSAGRAIGVVTLTLLGGKTTIHRIVLP